MEENFKQLLLVDLCARLPYDIKVNYDNETYYLNEINPACKDIDYISALVQDEERFFCAIHVLIEDIKPYLRTLSSMNKEERDRLRSLDGFIQINIQDGVVEGGHDVFDYLNSIHVSYRTLNGKDMFELGLALVAPEGMYNVKK